MPYYDKQKKRFVGQIRIDGRNVRKFFLTQKEAYKWEIDQTERPKTAKKSINTICLIDFLTQYLEFSEQKHSKNTFEEKKRAFRLLMKSIPARTPVLKITKMMILSHLKNQVGTRSGNSANKDRKNMVAAWNWGMKYIDRFPVGNPCLVDRFPETRKRRYVPPEEDFWLVFEQAGSEQDRAMLLAYLHLGARRSEIFTLRWSDVDFSGQQVRLHTRKRRDGSIECDWLPITESLMVLLQEWKKSASREWVFPDPETGQPYRCRRRWMKGLCKRAGVKEFGLHGIRHLTASILMQADVPLIDIKDILRHKNISTTERYIHRLKSLRGSLSVLRGVADTAESGQLTINSPIKKTC